jgi:hypothetical protein
MLVKLSKKKKVKISVQGDSTTITWTYVYNGIEAPDKCVVLRYKDGFLKYFIDNWNLYKIGSTNVNLSETEAISLAMERAKTYSWVASNDTVQSIDFKVANAKVYSTIFCNSLYMDKARDQDLLTLYPLHLVWVSLDKFYPGNVYGMNVYLWADTKEVGHIQEWSSTMEPPVEYMISSNDTNIEMLNHQSSICLMEYNPLSVLILGTLLLGPFAVFLIARKNMPTLCIQKRRFQRIVTLGFCFIMILSMLLITISTANATPYNGRATIWGSESDGAKHTPPGWSWRKTPGEVTQQQTTAAFLANKFTLNGYTASNYQGSNSLGSYKTTILAQIESNEANYARVAVVDFDHGNWRTDYPSAPAGEIHYLFEDNYGTYDGPTYENKGDPHHEHLVYDMDIADLTTPGNSFFVFINTCNSAHKDYQGPNNGREQGMPYAWTHHLVTATPTSTPPSGWMSCDGYNYADNGAFCYMGFYLGSASLTQSLGQPLTPYYYWLEHFFAYALTSNININTALNSASNAFFNHDFDEPETQLYTGFTASWPMYRWNSTLQQYVWEEVYSAQDRQGYLKVYGNGNLKLYQPLLNVNAYDLNNNQVWPTFYIDGNSHGTGNLKLYSGTHSITVSDIAGYTFRYFTYGGQTYYSRPVTLSITSDSTPM